MDWIKNIAPLLGSALGGPLGGAAATLIAEKLGLTESTVEAVKATLAGNSLSADQISSIKLAELDFKCFLEENKIKMEEFASADRKDARAMQVAVRSWVPAALSAIVTVGYFGILIGIMQGYLHIAGDSQALLILLGGLSTGWGVIMSFWFGTTSDSGHKTDLLAASEPVKLK
jgi:hypothetical protein